MFAPFYYECGLIVKLNVKKMNIAKNLMLLTIIDIEKMDVNLMQVHV